MLLLLDSIIIPSRDEQEDWREILLTFFGFTSGDSLMTLLDIAGIYFRHSADAGPPKICLCAHFWSLSRPSRSCHARHIRQTLESQSVVDTGAGTSHCIYYAINIVPPPFSPSVSGVGLSGWRARSNSVTMVIVQLDGGCNCCAYQNSFLGLLFRISLHLCGFLC